MTRNDELILFALNATREFGAAVAQVLGIELAAHEEREFEDGEHKSRPLVNVRGRDAYVIHSLYGGGGQTVNDKLCRLLFFAGALRDASAGRVTAVVPYLAYARKDRKSKPRDPVTTRYVAAMAESVGIGRIMVMDVHNLAAFQNAWRIPTDHLEARSLFVQRIRGRLAADAEIVVVSPDTGGAKRAEALRQSLQSVLGREVGSAFIEKYRSAGVVSGDAVVGDVAGRTAILIDDLISSGTTLVRAAEACRRRGATSVIAAATHGVFSSRAGATLASPALDRIIITNTVASDAVRGEFEHKLEVVDVAGMFAEAIARAHTGGSIVDLVEQPPV